MSVPALEYEQLEKMAKRLTAEEKVRLITTLTRTLEHEYVTRLPKHTGWPAGFIENTYGSLAEDPIERADQGHFEERDSLT